MLLMLTRRSWLAAALGAAAQGNAARPNIVVLIVDDLGYADLGFTGAKDIPTPHIDALAKASVYCTNGYVSHPFCSPTRAGLMTGRYQQRFGHENNPRYDRTDRTAGLPLDQVTLAQVLAKAGYRTGLTGKWHLGATPEMHPMRRGFREMYGFLGGGHDYFLSETEGNPREYLIPLERDGKPERFEGYLTERLSDEAAAFVKRAQVNEPFFLYLTYNAPHTPVQVPESYLSRLAHIPDDGRRRYGAMISAVDDGVGQLMTALKETGLAENTLLFFISDNGGPITVTKCSNGPYRAGKGSVYEGGIRVPFLVHWPAKLKGGSRFDAPVCSIDFFATACAAAGASLPKDRAMDSMDLLPFLTKRRKGDPHTALFWRTGGGASWAMRSGNWKLVRFQGKAAELFDLSADVGEQSDQAGTRPDVVRRMEERLNRWNSELVQPKFESPRPASAKKKASA
ncbi:MAG: hypothetical protein FJW30_03810 [Acidobacteria bacterium]|nr:hypothetical protein [Acidobacteriota bacterium]